MTARRPPPAGTIALTVTASFLAAHHAGGLAPAIAATHGYALAFTVSAALLGLGVILAVVLLPSRRRLTELRNAAAPAAATQAPAPQPERHAIPVALVGCSPVMVPVSGSPDSAGPVAVAMSCQTRRTAAWAMSPILPGRGAGRNGPWWWP